MSSKRFDLKKGYVPRRERIKLPVKLPDAGYPFDVGAVARALQRVNADLKAGDHGIGLVFCAVPLSAPEKVFVVGNMPEDMLRALFQQLARADSAPNKDVSLTVQ